MFQSTLESRRGSDVRYLVSWLRGSPHWSIALVLGCTLSFNRLLWTCSHCCHGWVNSCCPCCMNSLTREALLLFFPPCYAPKAKKKVKRSSYLLPHGMERQVLSPQGRTFKGYGQGVPTKTWSSLFKWSYTSDAFAENVCLLAPPLIPVCLDPVKVTSPAPGVQSCWRLSDEWVLLGKELSQAQEVIFNRITQDKCGLTELAGFWIESWVTVVLFTLYSSPDPWFMSYAGNWKSVVLLRGSCKYRLIVWDFSSIFIYDTAKCCVWNIEGINK